MKKNTRSMWSASSKGLMWDDGSNRITEQPSESGSHYSSMKPHAAVIYQDPINPFLYQSMEEVETEKKESPERIKSKLVGINFRKVRNDNPKM